MQYENVFIRGDGQMHISTQQDIIAVSAGRENVVALKKDGTVISSDSCIALSSRGSSDIWTDIVAISAGGYGTLGLKKDGSVVYAGYFPYKIYEKHVVGISKGFDYYVVIRENGTVKTSDSALVGDGVSRWNDIIAVSAGGSHIVGMKKDGTVVAVGKNGIGRYSEFRDLGQCDVSSWEEITEVSAGDNHTVGLKRNGTVVAVGSNTFSQCAVSDWNDIVSVATGDTFTIGLKKDGTVVTAGGYDCTGRLYAPFLNEVRSWTDIIAISAETFHVVGIKKDGSVVVAKTCGPHEKCDVSDWKLF